MSQAHITRCDNCQVESEDPLGQGWSRINVHPAGVDWKDEPQDAADPWLVRDLCPACAMKVRSWLTGELVAVFRRPRRGEKADEPGTDPA